MLDSRDNRLHHGDVWNMANSLFLAAIKLQSSYKSLASRADANKENVDEKGKAPLRAEDVDATEETEPEDNDDEEEDDVKEGDAGDMQVRSSIGSRIKSDWAACLTFLGLMPCGVVMPLDTYLLPRQRSIDNSLTCCSWLGRCWRSLARSTARWEMRRHWLSQVPRFPSSASSSFCDCLHLLPLYPPGYESYKLYAVSYAGKTYILCSADVYVLLGDIGMEEERFDSSATDYESALKLLMKNLEVAIVLTTSNASCKLPGCYHAVLVHPMPPLSLSSENMFHVH